MKFSKSLFLAFAGLGLFACSNEDVANNEGVKGEANVVVKIDVEGINGFSRNAGTPSIGQKVPVAGTVEVILNATSVNGESTKTVSIDGGNVDNVVFQGVENPQSVTVKVNGYGGEEITTLEKANSGNYQNLQAPMYGKAQGVVSSTVSSEEQEGKIVKNEQTGDYTVNFDLKPVVGRLEFSGIAHAVHEDGNCYFTEDLKLYQIDLVNGTDVYKEPSFTPALFTSSATFPKDGCYAYNVVDGTLPILRLTFSDVEYSEDGEHADDIWVGNPAGYGYAVINQYKLDSNASDEIRSAFGAGEDGVIAKFPAGYIYQVEDLIVKDENIHGEPTGEGVTLTAVIKVNAWTLVTGTATWK